MISIKEAIKEYKDKKNISNGGSECYDFGDAVLLVSYNDWKQDEELMKFINQKADKGVNTPRYLAIERVPSVKSNICYVLQEKCKGINCANLRKYNVSFDDKIASLEFLLNIPFDHYKKSIIDGIELIETDYEFKPKNAFYDEKSGFWYIDFGEIDKEKAFDPNDPKKILYIMDEGFIKPLNMASSLDDYSKLTPEQRQRIKELEYAIEAKTFLAIKTVIPNAERYEKMYLLSKDDDYKQYLMKEGVVKKDLMNLEQTDYEVFNELYEILMKGLIDRVINNKKLSHSLTAFEDTKINSIRINSAGLYLQDFFKKSKYNDINREDFAEESEYEFAVSELFESKVLNDLICRLEQMELNDNIKLFLSEASEKQELPRKTIK